MDDDNLDAPYWEGLDIEQLQRFLATATNTLTTTGTERGRALYDHYMQWWSKASDGFPKTIYGRMIWRPMSNRAFGAYLKEHFASRHTRTGTLYYGIEIKPFE
jgi:hypothetical protein